jgi:hypothetical protein
MPSTAIRSFHYNPDTEKLRVVFISGLVYDYKKVPQEEYDAMKAAYSKGIYLNKHIKTKYAFEKIG